jgi:hypothetical protein
MTQVTTELYGSWGCYIGTTSAKLVVTHPADMPLEKVLEMVDADWMYPMAREATEDWDGMHGFDGGEDEDDEEREQRIEDHVEGYCCVWDENKHAPKCTYGSSGKPDTLEIELKNSYNVVFERGDTFRAYENTAAEAWAYVIKKYPFTEFWDVLKVEKV